MLPHVEQFELAPEIAQRRVKLFLAGNPLGHVELPADLGTGLEERDIVASLSRNDRARKAGRPGSHYRQS